MNARGPDRTRPIEDERVRLFAETETEAKAFALFYPETYSPERQRHVRGLRQATTAWL